MKAPDFTLKDQDGNEHSLIISLTGEIAKRYEGVESDEHVTDIIHDLKQLQGRA